MSVKESVISSIQRLTSLSMRPTGIRDTLILCALLKPSFISEANQKSHHGHISYNLQGLSHLHRRPPTNVTASNGVGVDFICKVERLTSMMTVIVWVL